MSPRRMVSSIIPVVVLRADDDMPAASGLPAAIRDCQKSKGISMGSISARAVDLGVEAIDRSSGGDVKIPETCAPSTVAGRLRHRDCAKVVAHGVENPNSAWSRHPEIA